MEPNFEAFWEIYPRKIAKYYAWKCWYRLNNSQKILAIQAIPKHVRMWKTSGQESEFLPHASTWLNQRRWEDVLEQAEDQWWKTESGIRGKGIELGIYPKGGESWREFKARIQAALAETSNG